MRKEQIGNTTIFLADCMELMKQYPDKYFDLAICDPPFFSVKKLDYSRGRERTAQGRIFTKYKAPIAWNVPDNYYYKELCRVSKGQIIFGINYYHFENVPGGRIVWDKKKHEGTTFSDGEIASCSLINTVKFFRYKWDGMLQENMKHKEKRVHPTQKPIELYNWLLLNFAKPNWKILDTHLGSGSIAIACNKLGFDLTACEIDREYFNAACKRIKIEKAIT